MTKEVIHSVTLIVSIALSFVLAKTNLKNYDLQIIALMFLLLFLSKRYLLPKNRSSRLLESVIFTTVILMIVNTSGGTNSPLFFLVYFLLFSLSLLLEPVISITASLSLVIFYILSLPQGQDLKTLLPIFSLAFLTPFAMFMGQEYERISKLKSQNLKLENSLTQTKEDSLLFLSLMLKNHIKNIKQSVDNFLGDRDLEIIKRSTRRMEKLIDEYERTS